MGRVTDNCCSCGELMDLSRLKENKDYFFEKEGDEHYTICSDCKKHWDKVEGKKS